MHVLMVAPGDSLHSRRPLRWLLENGCTVTYLDRVNPDVRETAQYRFLRYPPGGAALRPYLGPGVVRFLTSWSTPACLRWQLRGVSADLVHVHWVDWRAYHCFKLGLRPLVLTVWGSDINSLLTPASDARARRAVGAALAGADLVIADSPDMPEKCAALAGRPLRTELLPIGIDTRCFRPGYAAAAARWRQTLALPAGATVFLSGRAFQDRYNHHLILEAFAQALGRLSTRPILLFKKFNSGKAPASAYETSLRRRADALGVSSQLRWLAEVPYDQLPELYALVDAVVNFPVMDAFPVTFLEAAACERPVITARLPSYAGTFAASCFRLVEQGDVAQLAAAIVQFEQDPTETRQRQATEARRLVAENHDEAVTARRLLSLYRAVLDGRRSAA
jgi:glycosyltransferase involved in cell wall biosynthesis